MRAITDCHCMPCTCFPSQHRPRAPLHLQHNHELSRCSPWSPLLTPSTAYHPEQNILFFCSPAPPRRSRSLHRGSDTTIGICWCKTLNHTRGRRSTTQEKDLERISFKFIRKLRLSPLNYRPNSWTISLYFIISHKLQATHICSPYTIIKLVYLYWTKPNPNMYKPGNCTYVQNTRHIPQHSWVERSKSKISSKERFVL